MNRVGLLLAAAILWVAMPVASVSAGLLSQVLSLDGEVDELTDDSVGTVVDNNNNGALDDGDYLVTILRLTRTSPAGDITSRGELDIVFAGKVQTDGVVDDATRGIGVKLTVASGYLQGKLGNHTAIGTNDVFAILTDPAPANDITQLSVNDAFNALNNSSSYQLEATGTLAGGDFFQAFFEDWNNDGAFTFASEYSSVTNGASIGSVDGGFTYTSVFGSPALATQLPLSVEKRYDPANATAKDWVNSWHQFTLFGSLMVAKSRIEDGWYFSDQSTMMTNLTPEPSLIVSISGMLMAGGGVWGWRRRRKSL